MTLIVIAGNVKIAKQRWKFKTNKRNKN